MYTVRACAICNAQSVWNTWELGLWEQSAGFQTHTHFLTTKEWDIIKGFALRGMAFARKFSKKKTGELLDMIDKYIHNNASTDAGLYWPGSTLTKPLSLFVYLGFFVIVRSISFYCCIWLWLYPSSYLSIDLSIYLFIYLHPRRLFRNGHHDPWPLMGRRLPTQSDVEATATQQGNLPAFAEW